MYKQQKLKLRQTKIKMQNLPKVTIIIPCRNEESFIEGCLNSVVNMDYPKEKIEIFVVDGLSTDKTVDIAIKYAEKYPFMKILKNEKRIFPAAVNLGHKKSSGEVIAIFGAHAIYESNYISLCVKYLEELEADNVGGVLNTIGLNDSVIGKAITNVLSSSFGVGNSTFRTGTEKIVESDTVFGGCYRKSVFEKIGIFNEYLISSSDMDFNTRLWKSGGKIFLIPEIIITYYTRSDFPSFCRNNFRNGVWAIYPMKFIKYMPVSLRHLIPLIFVSGLFGSLILSFFISIFFYLFLAIVFSYSLTNSYFSGKIASKEKDFRYFFVMPVIFTTLHISYGLGSVVGLVKVLFSKNFHLTRLRNK